MYAGRYLWWNMLALSLFVFFSVFFFYVAWMGIRLSGCAEVVGRCGALEGWLAETLRPSGLLFAGILVLTSTVLRIHYLKISLLWGLALFVWFGASTDFFFSFGNLWMANVGIVGILRLMPMEAWFLIALCAFLVLPIEFWQEKPPAGWPVISFVAGFTASYSFCFTIASSPALPKLFERLTGSDAVVSAILAVQSMLQKIIGFGQPGIMPMLIAIALFASSLSYFIVMRRKASTGGAPSQAAA